MAAPVAASAGQLKLFQKVNVLALHLSVPEQIEGGGKSGKAGADDISAFAVHARRWGRAGKGLIGACGIIHDVSLRFL